MVAERHHSRDTTTYGLAMTTRQKLDALIDETATRYFEGLTSIERDVTAIDTTLTGLRAIAKATDRLDRHLDEISARLSTIDKRLADLEKSNHRKQTPDDVLTAGLGLLRQRMRKLAKMQKRKKRK
jgi:Mg2+ and Co2+ transporter CorA